MKLESIRIENFRSFRDQTIEFDNYTCFVGPNGSGKSNVLTALNVFFRNNAATATDVVSLSAEDFHLSETANPIRITVTFVDLSEDAQETFKHYYRQGKLVMNAEAKWDAESETAEVTQHGKRHVMAAFAPFFAALNNKERVAELKEIYGGIRAGLPELPDASTKVAMENALRAYEESHVDECELLPDEGQFYGFSKGANRLEKYVQWVYIPAVKDASAEQDEESKTALGQLIHRTIRAKVEFEEPLAQLRQEIEDRYRELLTEQSVALVELRDSLQDRMQNWATPDARVDLQWRFDRKNSVKISEPAARVSIGEGDFIGEVARLGHGMQRAFIVSVLQELAESDQENSPTLILGFEEPELYQHPSQAQHMAFLLEDLGDPGRGKSQVVLTSHSPYFVSAQSLERVRKIQKLQGSQESTSHSTSYPKISESLAESLGEAPRAPTSVMSKIQQILQPSQKELFFCRCAVIVEGVEDIAYISTWLQLQERWSDFRKYGCHFVSAGGKANMSRLVAIAKHLAIPAYVVFDADAQEDGNKNENRRNNGCLLKLCDIEDPDPLPSEDVWHDRGVMWRTEVGQAVQADFDGAWGEAWAQVRDETGLVTRHDKKSQLLIAGTLETLFSQGRRSVTLDRLCDALLEYASNSGEAADAAASG